MTGEKDPPSSRHVGADEFFSPVGTPRPAERIRGAQEPYERRESGRPSLNRERVAKKSKKWLTEEEFEYLWKDQGFVRAVATMWEHARVGGYRGTFDNFAADMEFFLRKFLIEGFVLLAKTERDKPRQPWWE